MQHTLESRIARFFSMTDETWERHAPTPWSVMVRRLRVTRHGKSTLKTVNDCHYIVLKSARDGGERLYMGNVGLLERVRYV